MNIYFNDLTLNAINNTNDGKRLLSQFVRDVLKPVLNKTRLKNISCNNRYHIKDICIPHEKGILAQAFFTFFRSPYVEEDFSGSEEEERYCLSNFYIEKDGNRIECNDLGCAFMKDSLSLGFPSEPFWNKIDYVILEKDSENQERRHIVLCLTVKEHLDNNSFIDWTLRKFHSEPIRTELQPKDKIIRLRDDHGKDVLLEFAQRICQSPYVIQIVNSLPFQPNENHFINKDKPFNDGLIDVCLYWTEQGFGMVIKTTATNEYQAKKIAEILIEQFDPKQ